MTLRDIERWIHLGVLLPFVAMILAVVFGVVGVHGGNYEIIAGCMILMCVSGLVAMINGVRVFPTSRGGERQRVVQCILVGVLFGVGPLVFAASILLAARRQFGG